MVSYKKLLILFVIFVTVAFLNSVEATNSENILFNTRTLNGTGRPGETLEYQIFFTNVGTETRVISLNTLFPGNHDLVPQRFSLRQGERQEVSVTINLNEKERPRNVNIRVFFFDGYTGTTLGSINLEGKILEPVEPFRVVSINYVEVGQDLVEPGDEIELIFEVNNPVETTKIPVEVTSNLEGFETYSSEMEIKKGVNVYTIDYLTIPEEAVLGNYTFSINLKFSEQTIISDSVYQEVSGFSACKLIETWEDSTIFGKHYKGTVQNIGTEETTCFFYTPMSSLEQLLIKEGTEGYFFDGPKIMWELSLESGEETTVEYRVSYVPLIILPFVAFGVLAVLWYVTRKMWVKKELVDYKRHAGFMDLKIQLRLKNLTNEEMMDVKVFDPIPSFIKEIRDYGTVPGSVKKKDGKKVVAWEIDNLKPKEERVFSYKIRTSIEVLGDINFPPTLVEFTDKKGKDKESSNILTISVK